MLKYTSLISLLMLLFSCNPKVDLRIDKHSYAEPHFVQTNHLDLDIEIDFDNKVISGIAHYTLDNKNNHDEVVLDINDLRIDKVVGDDRALEYSISEKDSILGSALRIKITEKNKDIAIYFSTQGNAKALQFLNPQQTAGKKHPFLFTQSQAILARTWLPCQDSPGVRFTYNANVKVPEGLLAVMSAENPIEKNNAGLYTFKMKQAIPAYLMALAVGDLKFESIGEQTGIYAEPKLLPKAVYEFSETQNMLEIAESMYGPYAWDRYDMLVLPPSFPFGGMENPRLTFVTPTILAGDRSLTSLVAHELAHSWFW